MYTHSGVNGSSEHQGTSNHYETTTGVLVQGDFTVAMFGADLTFTAGEHRTTDEENISSSGIEVSQTSGFTLADDDVGDYFLVQVHRHFDLTFLLTLCWTFLTVA